MAPDLRHLRLVAAVARLGSLSRAACALGITQPTASRSWRELEEHLGQRLGTRGPSGVSLTEAGEAFAKRATAVVSEVDALLMPPTEPAQGPVLTFAWGGLDDAVGGAIATWDERHPGARCVVRQDERPLEPLERGVADIAVLRGVEVGEDWSSCALSREGRQAVVSNRSPLAGRERVTLTELASHVLVLNTSNGTTDLAWWHRRMQPTDVLGVEGTSAWIATVAAGGDRFGITPASTRRYVRHPGVRWLDVEDCPDAVTRLVWRRIETRPAIHEFLVMARELA